MLLFICSILLLLTETALAGEAQRGGGCKDLDTRCLDYIAQNATGCLDDPYVSTHCERTCMYCGEPNPKFDVKNVPELLQPLAFLIGIWRAETGGKAIFPTMPVFTYGEEMEISLPSTDMQGLVALNYSAHSWDMDKFDELHIENGYITMKPGTNTVALTAVMDNGFVTVEEGILKGRTIVLKMVDVGRISFSRDLPVHATERHWVVHGSDRFENQFFMETLTHRMQLHTTIVYKKIYP